MCAEGAKNISLSFSEENLKFSINFLIKLAPEAPKFFGPSELRGGGQ